MAKGRHSREKILCNLSDQEGNEDINREKERGEEASQMSNGDLFWTRHRIPGTYNLSDYTRSVTDI